MKPVALLAVALFTGVSVAAQQAPDRSKPPQPGAPPELKLPAIEKRQL